ncbi:MAG TPA: hypothetical protein VK838_00915 [Candidatus Limnocylindrales bacterium]|nr:hypothetical protein [Candidatus Limnocylindrales bacterium]
MADTSQLLYLEPDDEITSVVRRLRDAGSGRVVLVSSGRSKMTTSAVALRLLAGVAGEDGREIALVADASGRSLAAEAGIPAFASVAEASAEGAVPIEPKPVPRAPIHVVRGEAVASAPASPIVDEPPPQAAPPSEGLPPITARGGPSDETQSVPVVAAPPPRPSAQRAPRPVGSRLRPPRSRVAIGALVAALLLAGALLAAVAPAATIIIEPSSFGMDPVTYALAMDPAGTDEGQLTADAQGMATGTFSDPSPATGSVVIYNWSYVTVEIPQGMRVSADGEVFFTTTEGAIAPPGQVVGLEFQPSRTTLGIVAEEPGPSGNVAAEAINRVENPRVDGFLKGFPGLTGRRVTNPDATSGGELNEQPEITQGDVDAAVAEIQADLAGQLDRRLTDDPQRAYGPVEGGDPVIEVPEDLVGRRGEETFSLSGSLSYRRAYLERDAVEQAAADRLLADPTAVPEGTQVLADTVSVEIGEVTYDGDRLSVRVMVRAEATPLVNVAAVRAQVAGLTGPQAAEALQPLGDVSVELWPGWVTRVPDLSWRVDVLIRDGSASPASPQPSGNPSP